MWQAIFLILIYTQEAAYIVKTERGPKLDPCGTSQIKVAAWENIHQYLNQVRAGPWLPMYYWSPVKSLSEHELALNEQLTC